MRKGYALATPFSTTPMSSSSSARKVASCAGMNCGSRMAGIPSLGGPPPRISSGEMLCLVKSKPLRQRTVATRLTSVNPWFISPPDSARLEHADAVRTKLGHVGLKKEKAKVVSCPSRDLLNPYLRQGLLPCLIGFLPQGFRFAVVAMVAEDDDIVLPE